MEIGPSSVAHADGELNVSLRILKITRMKKYSDKRVLYLSNGLRNTASKSGEKTALSSPFYFREEPLTARKQNFIVSSYSRSVFSIYP